MVRHIIRPNHIKTTPMRLKEAFPITGKVIRAKNAHLWELDYEQDFFMAIPNILVANTPFPFEWNSLRALYTANKRDQRTLMSAYGLPVPEMSPTWRDDGTERFVVRPLRHMSGNGWEIIDNPNDYDPQTQYIAPLFPKKWEYRVIFNKGVPIISLLKRHPDPDNPLDPQLPWNHSNGTTWVTVHNMDNNRLRISNIINRIANVPWVKDAHILAFDVMLDEHYVPMISEVNFAPALTIEDNISKLVESHNHHDNQPS